jgi:hypothetical protein
MKKLTWKKKKIYDLTIWVAEVKSVDWQFSIEEIGDGKYQAFVYFGTGDDQPILPHGAYIIDSLKEAQRICNDWLHNTIIGLNKWI